ncbi:peptidase T-like protein [Enterococcus sp. 7F3_DIV0205]|uniref:Peptidase T-like protein n=1 Tax=Candidatus Enterococcus palustris TaxID=1834189 RepID=A0AAQ3WE73_9ENTE|nr:M20/M25/M40 family metallo-hydrolase [Enterococcus sp. 7F3_DIV0205]OTN83394.1 peptidase T-like protein [Enterococcus sp. 7F3_DIV0205]
MNKKRLVDTFTELVEVASISRQEGAFVQLLKDKLTTLGLIVYEDNSMETTKLGANNLIAKHAGNLAKEPIFFSCHVDTVEPGENIEVVEKNGILYSKGETILAADNKAGIAILLEMMETILENNIETGPIELVFSPGEEIGLIGAAALDMSLIDSTFGYVFDNSGPAGHGIVASPFLYMFDIEVTGKAAHAGLEPEKGISAFTIAQTALEAIPFGRLDEHTTSNIGKIAGGAGVNVVMEHLTIQGEVRSISDETARAFLASLEHAFQQASIQYGGNFTLSVDQKATGFHLADNSDPFRIAKAATSKIGRTFIPEISGGGSDANIFNAHGKPTLNLSIGYEEIHTVNEYIPITEMLKSVELALAILDEIPNIDTSSGSPR